MIDVKDVITLRVPYPDAMSELTQKSHMYICIGVPEPLCELVKCQRFKAYHLYVGSEPIRRIIEQPDVARNPFRHPTVIDLDKLFIITRQLLPDSLKTAEGINDTLFLEICSNLNKQVKRVSLSDTELQAMNYILKKAAHNSP